MNDTSEAHQGIGPLIRYARRHPLRWLVPSLMVAIAGSVFAVLQRPDWVASQALSVRDDYVENHDWVGQFNEAEQLRHAQETFLELARSPAVVAAALRKLGPPADPVRTPNWPSPDDVATTREKIEVAAPNGMEFGTTHLFYLNVANPQRQRAIELTTKICDESARQFRKLRDRRMEDAVAEMTRAVELASHELDEVTRKLREMETTAGSDLAELRMLSESFAGDSNLQTTLSEVQQERRQAETTYSANQELLRLLIAAQQDPANLVATPNRLLEAQPALRRLKEGLIDAQLNSSRLLGTMSPEHPRVKAARVAESEIRGHLHRELEVAVRGLGVEQSLFATQIKTRTTKVEDLQQRMRKMASMRASYSNQLAKVRQCTDTLTRAQSELDNTRATAAAGDVVTLVTRVDTPQPGPHPAGPGRSVLAAASCAGGLLVGLGVLVLSMPAASTSMNQVAGAGATPAAHADPQGMNSDQREVGQRDTMPGAVPALSHASTRPPAPVASVTPVGPRVGSMTLREALIRCNAGGDPWKS